MSTQNNTVELKVYRTENDGFISYIQTEDMKSDTYIKGMESNKYSKSLVELNTIFNRFKETHKVTEDKLPSPEQLEYIIEGYISENDKIFVNTGSYNIGFDDVDISNEDFRDKFEDYSV